MSEYIRELMKGSEGRMDYIKIGNCKGLPVGLKPLITMSPNSASTIILGARIRLANDEKTLVDIETFVNGIDFGSLVWKQLNSNRASIVFITSKPMPNIGNHYLTVLDSFKELAASVPTTKKLLELLPPVITITTPVEEIAKFMGETYLPILDTITNEVKILINKPDNTTKDVKLSDEDSAILDSVVIGVDLAGGKDETCVGGYDPNSENPQKADEFDEGGAEIDLHIPDTNGDDGGGTLDSSEGSSEDSGDE